MRAVEDIPWWRPETGAVERELVLEVLRSDYLNDGDVTTRFEKEMAELLGVRHAVAVTSGTTAIAVALMAVGIEHGDEVIVPDITFIATANAARLAGATVVLADVDRSTLTLDPDAFERAITSRTRAVVPVHVSGRAGTFNEICARAEARGIPVVEDAAEALLSRSGGRNLGTVGALGCFSFSPNKTVTTGQGGLVVTNDSRLHLRLRELKDHGRPVRGTGGDDVHATLGYNFKFTNLQAAVGLGQLRYLSERLSRQRAIYRIYRDQLSDVGHVCVLPFDVDGGETPQWTDVLAERRDELDASLRQNGASCRRFWFPIHRQKPYLRSDESFPTSTALSTQALWLPSAFQNTDEHTARVCDLIRRFYQ